MNLFIAVVCLLVISFVSFFIAYSEEMRSAKKENSDVKDFVDDPSILFNESSFDTKDDEDIEII